MKKLTGISLRIFFESVDNSPLILFRILFGALILSESLGAILLGWVKQTFIVPKFTFPFIGFEWLQPLPGNGMIYYYLAMAVVGLMIMRGWYYRLSSVVFLLMWLAVYLMQKSSYNNHHYLMILLAFFMTLVPANAWQSVDVRRRPKYRRLTCPQWCIWIFILQSFIVYFYAGVAKINPDWLQAMPVKVWFNAKSHFYLIGDLLQQPWLQYFVAYGGLLFDLLIIPALLWKRTRLAAFIFAIFFHAFNMLVFFPGIFPVLGMALTVFFFDGETIRRKFFPTKPRAIHEAVPPEPKVHKPVLLLFGIFFLMQIFLPLRHHLFPGNVAWTEEGHRLSWRMMLRVKYGILSLFVHDNDSGEHWRLKMDDFLTPKQIRRVATHPDMVWQFVQYLKKYYAAQGRENISIYARSRVSLNGRDYYPLIKDDVDLATVEWNRFKHAWWLMPFVD